MNRLHSTPWVHSSWSKKDILFLCDANDKNKISTDQPYISRPLSKSIQRKLVLTILMLLNGACTIDWRIHSAMKMMRSGERI
ncbi:hypothetical protein BDZ45DRAFT_668503 [Acephala macrosclerotiorum]|nr:hypothetical protein BDZ45DRAFT_668503 [Acephala macrosclerotiorum]